jgi:hypothetical protein
MTGAVPNALYRRITAASHSIDCFDVNHNGASAFAAHFALRHVGRRSALFRKSVSEGDPLLKKSAPFEPIVNPTIRSATAAGIDTSP